MSLAAQPARAGRRVTALNSSLMMQKGGKVLVWQCHKNMAQSPFTKEMVVSNTHLGNAVYLTKYGRLCIVGMTNAYWSTAIPSSGITLPVTAMNNVCAPAMYYSGTASTGNVFGFLKIEGNKLYLSDKTLANISKTYISGEIVFIEA